ncbi:MAG: hypothetical protein ABDH23_06945 [Endomicrobiia bacterium]
MKFFSLIIILLIILVLVNAYLIPYFYKNFLFLIFTIAIGVIVIILENLIKQKIFLYKKLYKKNLIFKTKVITTLIFILSIFNFSFTVLGFSINFIKEKRTKILEKKENEINFPFSTQIKGKVVSLFNKSSGVSDARLTLIHKDTNLIVDIFYTNVKGEFEYKFSSFFKEGGNFKLKIEHPEYNSYTTEFKISPFSIKELEIFLQPKKSRG